MDEGEGLRDRKKRELRQRISDTATAMFLEEGFDAVRVSDVAAACGVSEKTVYNYFPTKESLLLDREQGQTEALSQALRAASDGQSLVEAVVAMIERDLDDMRTGWPDASVRDSMAGLRRFGEIIEETPTLRAAADAMRERMTRAAAEALAERAGVAPDDPEPQLAAVIVMGLWRTQFSSLLRHAETAQSPDELHAAVRADIRRAAPVADSGLSSFNLVLQPTGTRDQLRHAAEVTNEARKQVIAAMKQARDAWKAVAAEAKAHHQEADKARADALSRKRELQNEMKRHVREHQRQLRDEIREHQRKIREMQAQLHRQHAEARHERGRRHD
jgi:AcrR family transcriptional regulator